MKRSTTTIMALLAATALVAACDQSGSSGSLLGNAADIAGRHLGGKNEDVDTVIDVAQSGSTVLSKSNELEPIGPREEYFIGRAVAANVIDRYGVVDDRAAVAYVNLLGQSIALRSDEPTTYGGYAFIILDTDEVNAVAAPGGFVMITRGLIDRCNGEDALAAVLAHEIAHVQERHGIEVIESARGRDFMLTLGREVAKNVDDRDVATLSRMLDDVVDEYLLTLLDRGYDRRLEYEADSGAVTLLVAAGYDPYGLHEVLAALEDETGGGAGWYQTHPRPDKRLAKLPDAAAAPGGAASPVRDQRFRDATATLR